MITPEDILTVMGQQAKTVCSKVVPQDRPNASTEKLTEFIVVSLPYSAINKTVGEDDDWWVDMTVVFEIYVADKKKASNPKELDVTAMKTKRESIFDLFPIKQEDGDFIIAFPRTVVNFASDGNGYHYTRVQAKLTTMV